MMTENQDEHLYELMRKEKERKLLTKTPLSGKQKFIKYVRSLSFVSLFLVSLLPRLYTIFFITDPDNPGAGWFGDAYHHWQIAYLTKEVGLKHGFLRLWDFKGMEYFWGALHPLLTMLGFFVSGSNSLAVERVITAIGGSISVVLLYLIGKKYWNKQVGLAAGLLAALNPVGIFNDGTGMIEPIGIPLLLSGILFWPKKPALSGIFFALAVMARSEYWVFSTGLVLALIFLSKKVKEVNKVVLGISFALVVLVYMKYLLDYTGNPIYPFWENYLANVFGNWQNKPVLETADLQGRFIFRIITAISVLFSGLVLYKRPKGWPMLLLGGGSWLFLGLTFGFSAYIQSWADYVWVVRFMLLQYMFLGLLLSVFFFYTLKLNKLTKWITFLQAGWIAVIAVLLVSQLAWLEIFKYYRPTINNWQMAKTIAQDMAKDYSGGGFLMPEGNPELTYALVQYEHIAGAKMVSSMFDPYFYMKGDPYQNWGENRKIVLNWLDDNDIKYMVVYASAQRYRKLAEHEPDRIKFLRNIPNSNLSIFTVSE